MCVPLARVSEHDLEGDSDLDTFHDHPSPPLLHLACACASSSLSPTGTGAQALARLVAARLWGADGLWVSGSVAQCLRAKIDMASPNLNMRDPALYR